MLYKISEAAKILGISPKTLTNLIKNGFIDADENSFIDDEITGSIKTIFLIKKIKSRRMSTFEANEFFGQLRIPGIIKE